MKILVAADSNEDVMACYCAMSPLAMPVIARNESPSNACYCDGLLL